jgi:cytochrome c oxidase cbb3-type subunit 4
MSKILKQYADQVNGIEIYPVFSLILFTLFFAGVLYFVSRMGKDTVEQMSQLPLDGKNREKETTNA